LPLYPLRTEEKSTCQEKGIPSLLKENSTPTVDHLSSFSTHSVIVASTDFLIFPFAVHRHGSSPSSGPGMSESAVESGAQPDGASGADPTRSQQTSEFVLLLKDREALKAALEEKEKELNSTKARNFELFQEVDKLEKEVRYIFFRKDFTSCYSHSWKLTTSP
jgi:hypothetical protein